MSSPEKQSPPPQSCTFLSLPYDIQLTCVARISRHNSASHWYILCRKPDKTLTNSIKSAGYVLARVPVPVPAPAHLTHVSVGSCIYSFSRWGSLSVSVMDCQSHMWAARFPVNLVIRSASVFDQKIYVAALGRNKVGDSFPNYFAVFDTKTQHLDPLPLPCTDKNFCLRDCYSACIDGKFYVMAGDSDVAAYDPKEGRWDLTRSRMSRFMYDDSYCVIGNVLYSFFFEKLQWYDSEGRNWRDLQGLVGLPKLPTARHVTLADYGGKMVVLWKNETTYDDDMSHGCSFFFWSCVSRML
ncbi:unnamed protein product [Microthlaspi erraticum]|uniref:FKB95-like N-terminal Kelch domain-containing protein n=1 Tax=Microthlaspi erraticum TaxID=1685480 RepID=A0A6D2KHN0_9BRAS|nr:unnamed protein product [Microthlaspi erraticum]